MTNKLTHTLAGSILYGSMVLFGCGSAFGQTTTPSMRFALPERTRLLQGQLMDLVVEIRNASAISGFKVTLGGADITARFGVPQPAPLDCGGGSHLVVRANLQSIDSPGSVVLQAEATAGGTRISDSRTIEVRPFNISARRNVILFIGDAMGTAYRDAARLVAKATVDSSGKNSFRQGFFDELLEMDKMPVSGHVMTYGSDSIVPDSANTGTAWASGNKSYLNALNSFADGTDCQWRFNGAANATASNSARLAATDSNMDVAYDKLLLPRPASEPLPDLGDFTDQPMLDRMTAKAIEFLSGGITTPFGSSSAPFILMVEGASIDKQSHPNNASGTIWDTIELDRAVGVARAWAASRGDTLIVVTADHDQSMSIIGVGNVPDTEYFDRGRKQDFSLTSARGEQGFTVFGDSYTNTRASLPFINSNDSTANRSGVNGMPASFPSTVTPADPYSDTYSTYFGFPGYPKDSKSGYPVNSAQPGQMLRRLAVGFRTGDHTGSSVPVTAEGPGAFLFTGYMDQTDLFFKMAVALSGDTADGDKLINDILKRYPATVGK